MRVLFVEDDAMNRRVVKDMLTIVDIDMAEAEDGETGLHMIDQNSYSAILMDLRMPGMDGLTAIRHIRDRTDPKGKVPIIVITADAANDLREKCLATGADDVLSKPVSMDALFDSLSDVLGDEESLVA